MNKRGFTLIELLAVIVILAIIAIIAVPIITNVIELSKRGAAEVSAANYIDTVEKQIMINKVSGKHPEIKPGKYKVSTLEDTYGVKVKGDKPTEGIVTVGKKKVSDCRLLVNGYAVACDNKNVEFNENLDLHDIACDDELDKKPNVELSLNNDNSIHMVLTDEVGVTSYAITDNPTNALVYIPIVSNKHAELDTDELVPGTYYVYAKNDCNKVSAKSIMIPIASTTLTFPTTSASNYTGGSAHESSYYQQALSSTKADMRGATSLSVSFYRSTSGGNVGSSVSSQTVGARLYDGDGNLLKQSPTSQVSGAMTYSYVFTIYDIEPEKLRNAYVTLYNNASCYRSGLYMSSPTATLSQDEPSLIFTPASEYLSLGGSDHNSATLSPAIESTQANLTGKTSLSVTFNAYSGNMGNVGSSISSINSYVALYSSNGTLLKQSENIAGTGNHTATLDLTDIDSSDLYAAYAVVQTRASCYRSGIGVSFVSLELN